MWLSVQEHVAATCATAGPCAHPGLGRTFKESLQSFTPGEMLRTPIFWLTFLMMTLMSTSGLMVISQMGMTDDCNGEALARQILNARVIR
jgi:hypothetical protein